MLDNNEFISRLDKGNALGVIAGQPAQLKQDFKFQVKPFKPANIVVAGMGGSALAAEFVRSWLWQRLAVPITIVRDYHLPAEAGKDSLIVVSSYSGNTEETLSCFDEALTRGSVAVVISAGGELKKRAAAAKLPHIPLPTGLQPRLAVFFGVKALATLLEQTQLARGLAGELADAADWLSGEQGEWGADNPTGDNRAKQVAQEIFGHPVVIYGGPTLAYAAMKWKIDINENAKNTAFYYQLPEFSHNEFNGWLFPQTKQFKVVELQSALDHPQIAKRFEVTNRLLSGKMPSPMVVTASGKTKLQQMLWTVLMGDFVSAYLAFLNGIDPTPVELIEKLKQELK